MKNSLAVIVIIASFVMGTMITATPQVEAAGGWKEAFDQLLVQINVLDEKVQILEENTENCQNEFLVKQSIDEEFTIFPNHNPRNTPNYLENIYELSTNCESEVIPLSITVNDGSVIGTYSTETTSWYDEETGESGEQLVYIADCLINSGGEFSENATFYDLVTITSISVENDGIHELVIETSEGTFQSGVGGNPPEVGMYALLFEKSDGVGVSTAEELIGTFTIVGEFTIIDI